jgi:hypothetical protein
MMGRKHDAVEALVSRPAAREMRAAFDRLQAGVLVAATAGLLATGGCAHPLADARRLPAWVFQSSRTTTDAGSEHARPSRRSSPPRPRGGIRGVSPASDFVVAALQGAGFRFGTDGTIPSLWGYLRTSQVVIPASEAAAGDVIFFRVRPPSDDRARRSCADPDHAGIVSAVERDGRITFVEAREGAVRTSYLDLRRPRLRRDMEGRVHNTFLHPKTIDDPPDTPNLAGETFCAAVRLGPR